MSLVSQSVTITVSLFQLSIKWAKSLLCECSFGIRWAEWSLRLRGQIITVTTRWPKRETRQHRTFMVTCAFLRNENESKSWYWQILLGSSLKWCPSRIGFRSASVSDICERFAWLGYKWHEMFVDDTKIWRKIKKLEDSSSLQDDLDRLTEWSRTWLLHFNPEDCKVMHIAHDVTTVYRLAQQTLAETECEKDLGTMQYNIRLLTIADMPQLSLKIYTIAIHTNIISTYIC